MPSRPNLQFSRVVSFVVDESPLWAWVLSFLLMIVIFAFLYMALSPYDHGIGKASEIGFAESLYFSVVTVSSLGYGDLQPEGASRILAGVEVLLGLAFIGVMIAKLTSKPLSHLVSRLFVSETRRQLLFHKASFDNCKWKLESVIQTVSQEFQQTPGGRSHTPPDAQRVERALASSIDVLAEASIELREYIRAEGIHRNYYRLAPSASLLQLAQAVDEAYFMLGQIILSLPHGSNQAAVNRVLSYSNRRGIDNVVRVQQSICGMIAGGVRIDEDVQDAFAHVSKLCTRISDDVLPLHEKPDQVLGYEDANAAGG